MGIAVTNLGSEAAHAQGYEDPKTLKPGQKGAKRLAAKYGKALLCVRYRYDKARGVMLETVEIIVEEKAWPPRRLYADEDVVAVAVAYPEQDLRSKLKTAGARWDPEERVWHVPYGSIRGTELEGRILKE